MDCHPKAAPVGFCSVLFSQVTAVKLSYGSFDVLCHNQSRNGNHICYN